MPSNHLILCCPLLLLPSVFPSIMVFSNELALRIRWPKYQSFSFNISPSNECSGLISFRVDWFDLLAVHGTCKSLLQNHSSKASIFWHSALFMVQLSHPYMTIGKSIALTRWTFVGNQTEYKTKRIQVRLLCRFYQSIRLVTGLPWRLIGKEPACNTEHLQCRRPSFNLWIGKIPWRRKQQPIPYSCLENPMNRGVLWAIQSMGLQELDMTQQLNHHHQAWQKF